MTCNCRNQAQSQQPTPQRKGVVQFCDICDPCAEGVSNVRLCAFVVPTLEEGRYFRNSFVFVQEDDSVYYIDNNRSEIPFGSRPKFINEFDPTDPLVHFKNTTVYDIEGHAAYVYGPEGNYLTIPLTSTPISSLTGGDGIVITHNGGAYTISIDSNEVASAADLQSLTTIVTGHTTTIASLNNTVNTLSTTVSGLEADVEEVTGVAAEALEEAEGAVTTAEAASQTASQAAAAVATKQDQLTAGIGISISSSNVISATASSPAWGSITGTLSNQTDLQSALEGKQNTITAGENLSFSGTTLNAVDTTYTAGANITIDGNNVISATAASPTWGSISGVITNQTDLSTILDSKQDKLTAGTNITITQPTFDVSWTGSQTGSATNIVKGEEITGAPKGSSSSGYQLTVADPTILGTVHTTEAGVGIDTLVPLKAGTTTVLYGRASDPNPEEMTFTVSVNSIGNVISATGGGAAEPYNLGMDFVAVLTSTPGSYSITGQDVIDMLGGTSGVAAVRQAVLDRRNFCVYSEEDGFFFNLPLVAFEGDGFGVKVDNYGSILSGWISFNLESGHEEISFNETE